MHQVGNFLTVFHGCALVRKCVPSSWSQCLHKFSLLAQKRISRTTHLKITYHLLMYLLPNYIRIGFGHRIIIFLYNLMSVTSEIGVRTAVAMVLGWMVSWTYEIAGRLGKAREPSKVARCRGRGTRTDMNIIRKRWRLCSHGHVTSSQAHTSALELFLCARNGEFAPKPSVHSEERRAKTGFFGQIAASSSR